MVPGVVRPVVCGSWLAGWPVVVLSTSQFLLVTLPGVLSGWVASPVVEFAQLASRVVFVCPAKWFAWAVSCHQTPPVCARQANSFD